MIMHVEVNLLRARSRKKYAIEKEVHELRRTTCFLVFLVIAAVLLGLPDEVLARAGGGGGGGGRGGRGMYTFFLLILYPFILAWSVITTCFLLWKNWKSKAAIRSASKDPIWDFNSIKARIEEVYFRVQDAWMERDQNLVKDCISPRLYQKHKLQTDMMIKKGTKNILEDVNLMSARIVEVLDFKNDSKDQFWIVLKGSMIDYTINESSKKTLRGSKTQTEKFSELWKFVRVNNEWLLDEIDQDVGFVDLFEKNSYVE